MNFSTRKGPWKASLRTHLVGLILIASVPIALLMASQIVGDIRQHQQRLNDDLLLNASAIAQAMGRELDSTIDALTILAHAPPLQQGDVDAFAHYLDLRHELRPNWRGIYLKDPDGRVLLDSGLAFAEARSQGAPPTGTESLAGRRDVSVSNVVVSPSTGQLGTTIEVPVRQGDTVVYVLGAWIDVDHWQDLLSRAGIPRNGLLSLYDRDYRLIARTISPELTVGKSISAQAIAVMQGRIAGVERTALFEDGEMYGAWHRIAESGWGVIAGVPAAPLDQEQIATISTALLTAALCLIAGVALAMLAARRITAPLQKLALGVPPGELGPLRVHEIEQLSAALLEAQALEGATRSRLQAKADEFETLFTGSPVGKAFAHDAQCRQILHNAAMIAMVGTPCAPGDPPGYVMRFQGREIAPEDQPLQRAARTGVAVAPMEVELWVQDRPVRHVIAQAAPLLDERQVPRGAIGVMTDITERKLTEARLVRADEQLRESQHLVDLAQEAGYVGFFRCSVDSIFATWTPGQAKLFGVDGTTFSGRLADWAQRIHQDDRSRVQTELLAVVKDHRYKTDLEYRVVLPNEELRWLASRILVSYGVGGSATAIIGVTFDITDRKTIEMELSTLSAREKEARLAAEASSRAKDEFLAMLGHELRNPLSAISSAAAVLERATADASVSERARTVIVRQTRHLSRLMDDLLDVGRVITGKVLLSRQPLDLAAVVQRLAATLEVSGEAQQHHLTFDARTPAWVHADLTRMEQVVTNLVANALKFTPMKGTIEVVVGQAGSEVVLQVRDNGPGIAPDLLPRVFDLFVQGERPLDRKTGGLGIGLTLVRRIVEMHGGRISAESSPQGTTFTVTLPSIEAPEREESGPQKVRSGRRQILLVEDNEDALATLQTLLEQDGHHVWVERSGDTGLESLLRVHPQLAIVDIGLPGLNGFELAKASRRAGYTGRLIALTGYGRDRDREQARRCGFDALLVKPLDVEELHRVLAES